MSDAASTIDWLRPHVGARIPGAFPPIAGYDGVRAAYEAWLDAHAR